MNGHNKCVEINSREKWGDAEEAKNDRRDWNRGNEWKKSKETAAGWSGDMETS